ncbi:MAG: hypothetical protein HC772_09715 [Leptolyngbyaceae cyanobacterium CRU_2_3]|nr:hypothetical protein [Leptolyngbyaceae cyanobacterium CRU_2_3]
MEYFAFRYGQYMDNTMFKTAIASMAIGLLGVYLGAAQVVFVGPIAGLFNPPYGMDVGFELGVIFAGVSYYLIRPIELKKSHR